MENKGYKGSKKHNEKSIIQKDILLSIYPHYFKLIKKGEKQWEYRRSIWSNNKFINRIYLYETAPIQKIAGYFKTNLIFKGDPDMIWNLTYEKAGIPKREFDNYFFNKEIGYALRISDLRILKKPISPENIINDFHPPQNFMYIQIRGV